MEKRKTGVVLLVIGMILSACNLTITGAVVGNNSLPGWQVLGLGFVIGGAVLVFLSEREKIEGKKQS